MWNSQGEFVDVYLTNHGSVIIGLSNKRVHQWFLISDEWFFLVELLKKNFCTTRKQWKDKQYILTICLYTFSII